MPFTNDELDVSFVYGEEKVELDTPLVYIIPENFSYPALRALSVIAPEGFVSDLASIPKVAQVIFSKLGKHRRAAVIHDHLYYTGHYTKQISDLIFLYAMKDDSVNIIKRRLMYHAVKYGGYFAWKNHRKRDEA